MRDYRLRAQRKRKQRESERRQGGVGFDRFLTSFFFFFSVVSIVEAEEMDEKRGTLRSSEQTTCYISSRRIARERPENRREQDTGQRERERERIAEKVDFRRAKVCRQKSAREREREREIERKREENGYYGSIGCSATRGLVSGSVDDDLLLYRNLLVFCPTYQR